MSHVRRHHWGNVRLQVQQYKDPRDIHAWFESEGGVLIISFKQVQLLAPLTAAKKESLKSKPAMLAKQQVNTPPPPPPPTGP